MSTDTVAVNGNFIELAAVLLKEAGHEMAYRTCNDYSLKGLLEHEDQVALLRIYGKANYETEAETNAAISHLPYVSDFIVMYALAEYLRSL